MCCVGGGALLTPNRHPHASLPPALASPTPHPPAPFPPCAPTPCSPQVLTIARALAQEYRSAFEGAPPAAAAGGAGVQAEVEGRHKLLVFELNRSGKYLQLKDSLKAAVVSHDGP